MVGEDCDFTVEGETKEEVKNKFFAHGTESELHREKYMAASDEEKAAFNKKIDEYLDAQTG